MIERIEPRDVRINPQDEEDLMLIQMCGWKLQEIAKQIRLMRKLILTEPARFDNFPDSVVRKRRMDEEAMKLRDELQIELNDLNVKCYSVFSTELKFNTWQYMWNLQGERDKLSVEESRKLMN
jgi:hypothetical protein